MNWQYVLNTFIAGLVLLSLAKTVTVTYALYVHPKGEMVRNATTSTFEVSRRFAEIGMKGALAALQFAALDDDHDDKMDLDDLCATFGRIRGVTFEQALSIVRHRRPNSGLGLGDRVAPSDLMALRPLCCAQAHLVIEKAKDESKQMRKARAALKKKAEKERAKVAPTGDKVVPFGGAGAGAPAAADLDERSTIDFGKFLMAREGGGIGSPCRD